MSSPEALTRVPMGRDGEVPVPLGLPVLFPPRQGHILSLEL